MKTIFVIGPYNAPTLEQTAIHIEIAADAAKYLWVKGYAVLCPHTNSGFFDGTAPETVFYRGYQELLKGCSHVFVLPGWERSKGSLREIFLAVRLGLKIRYSTKAGAFSLSSASYLALQSYIQKCRKEDIYESPTTLKDTTTAANQRTSEHMVS